MTETEVYQEYLDAYEDAIDQVLKIVRKYVNKQWFLIIEKEVRSTLLN
jgi:hypothetical protein